MTRASLSSVNRAEVTAVSLRAVELLDIAFPSGTLRVASGDRDVVVDGSTYTASASYLGHGGLTEDTELSAKRIRIGMSGLDATLLTRVMNDNFTNAAINVRLGLLTAEGQLVGTPYPLCSSIVMSAADITLDQGQGLVEVSGETYNIFTRRNSQIMVTPQTQRLRYTGDSGCDNVMAVLSTVINWGGGTARAGHLRFGETDVEERGKPDYR